MILASILKQMGGTVMVEKKTFMDMPENHEILISRNVEGNLVLTLIEDEEGVADIRSARAELERKQALSELIVP